MDKQFPPTLTQFVRTQKNILKIILLLETETDSPADCHNCGGIGQLYLFAATEGPYKVPTAPYRTDDKVSKFHDGKWWVGNTVGFTCPVCGGLGRASYKPV